MLSVECRRRLEQGSALVAAVAGAAYPLTLHLAPQMRFIGPIVLVLGSALALRLALSALERPYKLLGALLAGALIVGALVAGPARLLLWQPALLNLTLLCAFGFSLYRGTPLIERIARARRMAVGPHNVVYLRCLTGIWTGFFAVATALSVVSATATHEQWVLWNGSGVYVAIALLLLGERLYRIRYKRYVAREGLMPDRTG